LGEGISDGFEARMRRLKRNALVRAIVMLRRDRGAQRSVRAALGEMDAVLARVGGQRLSKAPNALGYVVVEATPAGIRALAASAAVRGVLEDQPVRLAM
jgi:hypothetical protein